MHWLIYSITNERNEIRLISINKNIKIIIIKIILIFFNLHYLIKERHKSF